ncbi:RIP metalloprotease RseP [Chitinispirillales bacterium ANBcel5]|uniref:RIP metalloprotease RseP n=1 Tax=Cellulosispirillum alkaliphilum TaxID=3039283 RepID=UPI002A4FAAC0|nr:RIP metalloprotease RseP [Chitinispirillales bacterium ANBcel5]
MTFLLSIAIGLLVLGVLVFVHELGHFLAAKACKIKVLTFSLGFGPALLQKKHGDTEYRISAVPFGGYVKMAGDNPEEHNSGSPDEFNSKPIWQRAIVAIAGPAANFVFAFFLLWFISIYGVEQPLYKDSTNIGAVLPNSAAYDAGIQEGDRVIKVNDETVTTWNELESHLNRQRRSYDLVVERDAEKHTFTLNIEYNDEGFPTDYLGGIWPSIPAVIGNVAPKSAADLAGIKSDDTITQLNDTPIHSFHHLSFIISNYDDQQGDLQLTINRDGETITTSATPQYDEDREAYMLGIVMAQPETRLIRYSPADAVGRSIDKSWEYTTAIFRIIGQLFSREVSTNQLSGPLGIIPMSGFMALQGLSTILDFMALIGINLAILNLLPLVITDGGLLFFMGLEAVRGKPLPKETQLLINKIAIFFFLGLFLLVTFNDVKRLPILFEIFGG